MPISPDEGRNRRKRFAKERGNPFLWNLSPSPGTLRLLHNQDCAMPPASASDREKHWKRLLSEGSINSPRDILPPPTQSFASTSVTVRGFS